MVYLFVTRKIHTMDHEILTPSQLRELADKKEKQDKIDQLDAQVALADTELKGRAFYSFRDQGNGSVNFYMVL